MKKLYAIILIFTFTAFYIPAVQALCNVDNAITWVDFDEEKDNDSKKDDKKELKDMLGQLNDSLQDVKTEPSYGHNSHLLGDNPAENVLTPPPNQV